MKISKRSDNCNYFFPVMRNIHKVRFEQIKIRAWRKLIENFVERNSHRIRVVQSVA